MKGVLARWHSSSSKKAGASCWGLAMCATLGWAFLVCIWGGDAPSEGQHTGGGAGGTALMTGGLMCTDASVPTRLEAREEGEWVGLLLARGSRVGNFLFMSPPQLRRGGIPSCLLSPLFAFVSLISVETIPCRPVLGRSPPFIPQ